jgi:RNA polymerase sigma factor (sigma-70 family)
MPHVSRSARGARGVMSDPMEQRIKKALAGDPIAQREIVAVLTPAIQIAVADVLRRHAHHMGPGLLRQEVEDQTQAVFLALFDEKGKRLLTWKPHLEVSLPVYVKTIARNLVRSFLRSPKNRSWNNVSLDREEDGRVTLPEEGPELAAEQKEIVVAAVAAVEEELPPKSRAVFDMTFRKALPVEEICERTGMSKNAVSVARSRFIKQILKLARHLQGEALDPV